MIYSPDDDFDIRECHGPHPLHASVGIGPRVVIGPTFADTAEWSSTKSYEPLTVVLHEGNSYTSKRYVPVGIDISNTKYWAETGNYNSQVAQYKSEVDTFDSRISMTSMQARVLSLRPMIRPEIVDDDLHSTQGFCVFGDDRYVAIGGVSDDDSISKLFIYDVESGDKVSETMLPIRHCNTLSERDNVIVVADGIGNLLFIDVATPLQPYITRTISIPDNINTACWYKDDSVICIEPLTDVSYRLIVIDVNHGEVIRHDVAYENKFKMIPQGIAYDGKYIYRAYSDYNNVLVFDGETFEKLCSFNVPESIGYIKVGELEQVYFTDKGMYVCSNTHLRDSISLMPLIAMSRFNDFNESAFPNAKINNAIVSKSRGYNLIFPNAHNSSNVFRYFEDALNSGASSIEVQDYDEPINISYKAITISLKSGCTSQLVIAHSNINLLCDDNYFTIDAPASNSISLLNEQQAQIYLYRCTGSITVSSSGEIRDILIDKLRINKTFQFVFRDCTINCASAMMGFACNNSILTADLFSAPYFIKDNNSLVGKNFQIDQNSPCLIYGDNEIECNTVSMRRVGATSFTRAVVSGDILPIVFARDLRTITLRFTFEYNKNDVNPSNINNYGVRVPVARSANNRLELMQFKYSSAAWPAQLETSDNFKVYGVRVDYGELAWEADGTAITPPFSLENHVFMD